MDPNDPLVQLATGLLRKSREPDLDGYKPLPYQIAFHSDRATGRLNFGGNRSGKSYSSVVEMVWWATGTHPYRPTPRPPVALRHVAVDRPQGIDKILKELYKKIIPPRFLRGGSFEKAWQNQPPTLHFDNGSFIEFMTYEQELDAHAGVSRHAIAFDEEPDEAIFNENMARLVDTGGEWWIAMTPVEGLTWVYDRYVLPWEAGTLNEDVTLRWFDSRQNSYLPSGAVERLFASLTAEERKMRLEGTFMSLSGLVYPFSNDVHVHELIPQPNLLTIACMDHGLKNPTAWLWFQVDADGNFYFIKEHYASEMLVKDHARAVTLVESGNRLLVPSYRVGDPSILNRTPIEGQSVHSEYAIHGITIAPGNNDVNAGINRVASLMDHDRNRIFIDRSCRNLIREFRTYRWDEWQTRKMNTQKEAKAKPKKKDDHALDALRYGVMSRPLVDSGNGPLLQDADPQPGAYATPTLVHPAYRDHRDSGAYDDMGSEW